MKKRISNFFGTSAISQLKEWQKSPLFIGGLIIRIFLIIFFLPKAQNDWFLPFFSNSFQNFSFNPWSSTYLLNQPELISSAEFPYGIVMYMVYLPLTYLGYFLDKSLSFSIFSKIGFGFTSLILDYFSLIIITTLLKKYSSNILLISYWLSPLSIFIIYVHGQIDILPVFLMIIAISFLRGGRFLISGISFGFAISAKFSMAIALPLIIIYIYKRNGLKKHLKSFCIATFFTFFITTLPWSFTDSFLNMVMFPKETSRIFNVYLSYGDNLKIYLLPTAYFIVLYLLWRIRRITFDLFIIFIGIGFFSLLILLPPSPGWFLWVLPFLVFYQLRSEEKYSLSLLPFSFFFLIYFFIYEKTATIPLLNNIDLIQLSSANFLRIENLQSFMFTCLQASGLIICLRMYIFGLRRNQYYQNGSQAFVLAISNKDEKYRLFFLKLLNFLNFSENISYISEDSYRNFERNNLIQKKSINLPNSSNLNKLSKDVFSLLDGKSVKNRRYSNKEGKYISINKIRASNTILIGTYSSNYPKRLANKINLNISLILDKSIDIKKLNDRFIFIKASNYFNSNDLMYGVSEDNKSNLDIEFRVKLINPNILRDNKQNKDPLIKLIVIMANGFFHEEFIKCLISLCSVHVDLEQANNSDMIKLTIDGDISSEDIDQISKILIPNQDVLVSEKPKWQDGIIGIIQLITLVHISESLHR